MLRQVSAFVLNRAGEKQIPPLRCASVGMTHSMWRIIDSWHKLEEGVEAAGVHVLLEGGVSGVVDGLHADGEGGFDVFRAVVDEEDVGRWGAEAFGGVEIDGGFGFEKVEGVGPGVVVEGFDPKVAGAEACLYGVGHVGQDAGADAGALEALRPFEHGRVELRPEVGVGGDEFGELCG